MNTTRQSSFIRITVKLTLQPSGGYTVTCKELPELFTDGRTIEEALHNVEDALIATIELYEDTNKKIPACIFHSGTITSEKKSYGQKSFVLETTLEAAMAQ